MSIEAMPLYVDIERIDNEIRELGRDEDGPLEPAELFPFDQIHYQGTDAVERAIRLLGLDTVSQIESHMLTRHYEGFMKKGRIRGRA